MKNKPVKVIKRSQRAAQQQEAVVEQTATKKSPQEAAREVVATVSNWVQEFQQKRRTETAQAIKTLFADSTPQTSKA
ncbi:MAG: hypothetical protein ACRD9R_13105 [Pyrinomonadaceae bacterium]